MSYIRCLSNMEGLYIWGNVEPRNTVTINPGSEGDMFTMPTADFHYLLRMFLKDIYSDKKIKRYEYSLGESQVDFHWHLSHPSWKKDVIISRATLFYLAKTNEHRWKRKKKK